MDISLITDEIMNVVTSGSIFTVAGRDEIRGEISRILTEAASADITPVPGQMFPLI